MLRFRAERACALAVALLAVQVVATASAHAQQPTPTPTERQTSTITIRFVRDGEPVEVFFFSYPAGISADGVACQFPIPDGGVVGNQAHTEFSLPWPFLPIEGQPKECTKGPPTTIRIEFDGLFAEVLWTGDDVTVDLEVPGDATTPTPAPTSVVEKLPGTGFASHETSGAPWLSLALLLAAFTLLLLGAAVNSLTGSDSDGGRSSRPST